MTAEIDEGTILVGSKDLALCIELSRSSPSNSLIACKIIHQDFDKLPRCDPITIDTYFGVWKFMTVDHPEILNSITTLYLCGRCGDSDGTTMFLENRHFSSFIDAIDAINRHFFGSSPTSSSLCGWDQIMYS